MSTDKCNPWCRDGCNCGDPNSDPFPVDVQVNLARADQIPEVQQLREALYRCPKCGRAREWTDGRSREAGDEVDEYWCQVCGAEVPLASCERTSAPSGSAQEGSQG